MQVVLVFFNPILCVIDSLILDICRCFLDDNAELTYMDRSTFNVNYLKTTFVYGPLRPILKCSKYRTME